MHCLTVSASLVKYVRLLQLLRRVCGVHFWVHRWMEPMTVAEHMAAWDATHLSVNRPCVGTTGTASGIRKRGSSGKGLQGKPCSDTSAAPDSDCAPTDGCIPSISIAPESTMS